MRLTLSSHTPLVTVSTPWMVAAASSDGRYDAVRRYATDPVGNRALLFGFLTDLSTHVRGLAANALSGLRLRSRPTRQPCWSRR